MSSIGKQKNDPIILILLQATTVVTGKDNPARSFQIVDLKTLDTKCCTRGKKERFGGSGRLKINFIAKPVKSTLFHECTASFIEQSAQVIRQIVAHT